MAAVKSSTKVIGLDSTLKELKKIEPAVYKAMVKDVKKIAGPTIKKIQQDYPSNDWVENKMSNFRKGRLAYDATKVRRGVKIKIGGTGRRTLSATKKGYPILSIVQTDAAAILFDMAGVKTPNGGMQSRRGPSRGGTLHYPQTFIPNVESSLVPGTKTRQKPSRVMYFVAEGDIEKIERESRPVIDSAVNKINRKVRYI